MKIDTNAEWNRFKSSLTEELRATPIKDFTVAWGGRKDKTGFYGSSLLPRIAKRCGMNVWYEFLRCDFVLANDEGIPLVFVESENCHGSASEEIEKLCCIAAPVKALFLSCSWYDSEREAFIDGWLQRIRKQHDFIEFESIYMIVVGEWGTRLPTCIPRHERAGWLKRRSTSFKASSSLTFMLSTIL
jgi:hypothetical protein